VEREPEQVIPEIFQEAQARAPDHEQQWVALVDGNKKQLRLLKEQAKAFAVIRPDWIKLSVVVNILVTTPALSCSFR